MRVILATNNQNKANEVKKIINDKAIEIFTLSELNLISDPEETGLTFLENAIIKAESALRACNNAGLEGYAIAADDSGLCVDALDGGPGVFSARYAQINAQPCTYDDNNEKMLKELACVPDDKRSAYFQTTAVLILPDGSRKESVGKLFGKILREKCGENGFGYDPIFQPEGMDVSLAQLSPEEKNSISHRSKAFRGLFN